MAITIPEKPTFRTNGERLLYEQLIDKLSNEWIVFYEPIIQAREPDFVLLNAKFGIVIIEVKDYRLETINSFNPLYWKVNSENGPIKVTSPLRQVINYRNILHEFLSSYDTFTTPSNRLLFPIHTMCAFPYLTNNEIKNINLDVLFTDYNILSNDDLYNIESFYKKIDYSIEKLFLPEQLDDRVVNKLINTIFPSFETQNVKSDFAKNTSNIDISEYHVAKLPSVITEILYISDEVVNIINTKEVNFNKILIVTNAKRLGRYNAYQYREILIKELQFKHIPLHGQNGIQFMSYDDLIKNKHIISDMDMIFSVDFNSTPNEQKVFILQHVKKDNTLISTNTEDINFGE